MLCREALGVRHSSEVASMWITNLATYRAKTLLLTARCPEAVGLVRQPMVAARTHTVAPLELLDHRNKAVQPMVSSASATTQ